MSPTTSFPAGVIASVAGRGVPVRGDDIDTDRIIPGRFLRCVTFEGLEEHVFEDDRQQLKGEHSFDQGVYVGASVLVANNNFGCGSSREHAPQSLIRWGIRGIVAESFAEIFFGNCVALGVPCLRVSKADASAIQAQVESDPSLEVTLDLEALVVRTGAESYEAAMADGVRGSFLAGTWDATAQLLAAPEDVAAVVANLPYLRRFAE